MTDLATPLAAFLASHDALQNKLWGYLSRRIPDQHGVEQAFHDTLLAIVRYLDKGYVPDAPMIFGIARRKVNDHWREQQRRAGEVLTEPTSVSLISSALTGDSADSCATVPMVVDIERALAKLSHEHQRVLVLRYIDQLTQEEAAVEMHITRHQLRRLEADARKKLAEGGMLDGYQPPPTTPEDPEAQA